MIHHGIMQYHAIYMNNAKYGPHMSPLGPWAPYFHRHMGPI